MIDKALLTRLREAGDTIAALTAERDEARMMYEGASIADQQHLREAAEHINALTKENALQHEGLRQAVVKIATLEARAAENAKLLLRWLQLTNLAKREPGATVADWDGLRQATDAALKEKP